jgi:hypothetical protein
MTLYLILFILLFFYTVIDRVSPRIPSLLIFISIGFILFVIAGFRSSNVDRDYLPYVDYFQSIKDFGFYFHNSYLTYAEPFYYFIPLFFKTLSNGYFIELTFLLFALVGVCFKLRGIYLLTSYWALSLLIYYSNFFLLHEMTQIRIGVATGLFLIAIKHYVKKNNIKSFIAILIAIMFHYSSILMLVLFLLKRDTIKLTNYFIVIGISIICYLLHVNLIVLISKIASIPKILVYIDLMSKGYHSEINVFNVMLLFNLMITLLLSYKINMILEINKNAIILLKLNLISIILFIALYSFPVAAFRLSEIFGVVQIVLFTYLFYIFKEKWFSYFIIVIYSLLFFYMNIYRNNILSDYKLIF